MTSISTMQNPPALLGTRVLWTVLRGGLKRSLRVSMHCPTLKKGSRNQWECLVSFRSRRTLSVLEVPGADALDALQNALIAVSAELYLHKTIESEEYTWRNKQHGGFPEFPSLRINALPPLRHSGTRQNSESDLGGAVSGTEPEMEKSYSLTSLLSECTLSDMLCDGATLWQTRLERTRK